MAHGHGRIAVHGDGEVATLLLSGEFDLANVGEVEAAADGAIRAGAQRICLDLHAVTFMDSSMLNLMVNLRNRLAKRSGRLTIEPSMQIRKLLEISGLGELFELLDE